VHFSIFFCAFFSVGTNLVLCVCAGIVVGDTPCIVSEDVLCKCLCCEPTVQVRRSDVLSRWRDSCDLSVLIFERDEDWHEINVLGNFFSVFHYTALRCNDVISYLSACCCRSQIFSCNFW